MLSNSLRVLLDRHSEQYRLRRTRAKRDFDSRNFTIQISRLKHSFFVVKHLLFRQRKTFGIAHDFLYTPG